MPTTNPKTSRTLLPTFKQEAVASKGMVATNHPLASASSIQMLAMGGNAADAAVAALFTLSVVEPMMVGIFGAGFVNYHDGRSNEIATIDAYTMAPNGATPDMFQPVSNSWPDYLDTRDDLNRIGHLAAGVPGTLKCWCHVQETYGRLPLDTVLQPAIQIAEQGFPASNYLVDIITDSRETLGRFPSSRELYLPRGVPPIAGEILINSDYANVLRDVSKYGDSTLYQGRVGDLIAAEMERCGGLITADDMKNYEMHSRNPVKGTYRGYEIASVGPTSSGGIAILQCLNILEGFDVSNMGFGTTASIHLLSEVLKIVFADRFEYVGDPNFVDVPIEGLTSKKYADKRRREINLNRAAEPFPDNPWAFNNESNNTTHVTVADDEGNIVSMTQTINEVFGAKVVVPGTGMLLNNTMYLFDPHPGQPNSIAPRKRMLSSMSPTIVLRNGKPFLALGTPGGRRIFAAVLQAIVNVIDHGLTLQQAVEAPRIWTQGQAIEMEAEFPSAIRQSLQKLGHQIQVVPRVAGGMNGIMFDENTGMLHGAACWRADGTPIGISGGYAKPSNPQEAYRI